MLKCRDNNAIVIRPMAHDDIEAVIGIHQAAFPGFFLTRMGPRFLRGYYAAVLGYPDHIALLAETEHGGKVLGFATGFQEAPRFYFYFRQRRRHLWLGMTLAVLRAPSLAIEILRNVRRVATELPVPPDATELSSIAVTSEGKGIGGKLLEEFINAASTAGSTSVYLTTDADNNEQVRRFYESRGFTFEGTEVRRNRSLCRYARPLP